jgi:hypothetical protein
MYQTSSNMFRSIKPRGHVVPVESMSDLMPSATIIVRRHDPTVKTCPIPCSLATIIVSEQELTGYTKVHMSFVLHETMQRTLCAPGF